MLTNSPSEVLHEYLSLLDFGAVYFRADHGAERNLVAELVRNSKC